MTDRTELKRLAEAFPADLDWDSNTEPFFNGPSGESLGGGSTGFYCVYGAPFEIDCEQYDGHTYVETCKVDFAKFMCAARDGVLALIAENDSQRKDLQNLRSDNAQLTYALKQQEQSYLVLRDERDQLRAEVAGLKTGYEAYGRVNAELKAEIDRLNDEYDKAWRHNLNDKNNFQALTAEVARLSVENDALRKERDARHPFKPFHEPSIGYTGCVICGMYTDHGGLPCPKTRATADAALGKGGQS